MMIFNLLLPIVGYFFGSISSAILIAKLFSLPDPRTQGSKNPGATNILRIGGKLPAALTLLGDVLKGLIPVLLAKMFGVSDLFVALTGLMAFIGHCFPCFFNFQGGKGVATAIGVLFGFHYHIGLTFLVIWILCAILTRYSSLSALVAIAITPIFTWLFTKNAAYAPAILIIGILVYWRHTNNIKRLLKGEESKIGKKK